MSETTRGIKSICFVAPWAYPTLVRDANVKVVGGSEVQQSILAREFVRRGYQVSMVCLDYGQPDRMVVDGVTIYRAYKTGPGAAKIGTLGVIQSIWNAMAKANADLYYQQNCSAFTGYVASYARLKGKLAVYCGASDEDFVKNLPRLHRKKEKLFFRLGLRLASAIIAQSERQVAACQDSFGLKSEVIRSCYGHQGTLSKQDGVVLWSGRLAKIKRPELYIELAKRCPEFRFRMVGGGEPELARALNEQAAGLGNIDLLGFVPYAEVEQYFDDASVIVNTSPSEGFPNTFLQGWSRGMPSLSFFDPAARVHERAVGVVVEDMDQMAAELRRLKNDLPHWQQHSADSKEFFSENFALDHVADEYESLFRRLGAERTK